MFGKKRIFRFVRRFWLFMALGAIGALMAWQTGAAWAAALPEATPIPTVTGTPMGPVVVVLGGGNPQVNVRAGPSSRWPIIGILIPGERVPAIGRTPAGEWIKIVYPGSPDGTGWVYAYVVRVEGGDLPIVEPPPTPTPLTTPTVDPTLAAQFLVDVPPTRLPTFTAPPPLVVPTFVNATPVSARFPSALVILGLFALGLFGMAVSFWQRR